MRKFIRKIIGDAGTKNLMSRQEWVEKKLCEIKNGSKILDAGAGEQQYRKFCSHLDYTSQDFNEYKGIGNHEGLQTGVWDTSKTDIVSDILSIPIEKNSFDVILCTEVFEHIPNPIAAIDEFYRLLKPGGILIVTAPFNSLTHFAPYHYYSGFSKYFYEYFFPKAGFKITELIPNGDYSEYIGQEVRRIRKIYNKSPFLINIALTLILRFINKNKTKVKTSDLGCFGYHIVAYKEI